MAMSNPSVTVYPTVAQAITPSDSAGLGECIVYVGVAGDVTVLPAAASASTPVLFKNVPAGSVVPCMVQRVYATGTTATNLVRLA